MVLDGDSVFLISFLDILFSTIDGYPNYPTKYIYVCFYVPISIMDGRNIIMLCVVLVVAAVVMSALMPIAMTNLADTNVTGWPEGTGPIYGVYGIFFVIAGLVAIAGLIYKSY